MSGITPTELNVARVSQAIAFIVDALGINSVGSTTAAKCMYVASGTIDLSALWTLRAASSSSQSNLLGSDSEYAQFSKRFCKIMSVLLTGAAILDFAVAGMDWKDQAAGSKWRMITSISSLVSDAFTLYPMYIFGKAGGWFNGGTTTGPIAETTPLVLPNSSAVPRGWFSSLSSLWDASSSATPPSGSSASSHLPVDSSSTSVPMHPVVPENRH